MCPLSPPQCSVCAATCSQPDVRVSNRTSFPLPGIVDCCDSAKGETCLVRPNHHTFNGSFTHFDQTIRNDLHVAVKSAHIDVGGSGDATVVLLTANASTAAAAKIVAAGQLELHVSARFYFDCAPQTHSGSVPCGTIVAAADGQGLVATPIGQPAVHLIAYGARVSVTSSSEVVLTMGPGADGGAACLVAVAGGGDHSPSVSSVAQCTAAVAAAEAAVEAGLEAEYPRAKVGDTRDVVDAIRAVIGWNTMYDGRAFVITPVSRSFGKLPFEMWLWDTYFSTLLSAESSKELAYANLIEITRPTAMGNVPGFRTATDSVQDRSKPFVGAMVLEMLYGKFKDAWLVELLFDDLLIWANWIRDHRIEEPAGLVVLGSDNVAPGQSDGMQCTRTAVAWESGLDNSPLCKDRDTSHFIWNPHL